MGLGPMMERCLRQPLLISRESPAIFIDRPISAILLGVGLISLIFAILPHLYKKKRFYWAGGVLAMRFYPMSNGTIHGYTQSFQRAMGTDGMYSEVGKVERDKK